VLALAGCGSSGKKAVTLPAYGDHPATTVAAGATDPKRCTVDADAFGDAARMFLAHSGSRAAYPADLYVVLLRNALADFQAQGCDPAEMGAVLRQRLTPAEREQLVDAVSATLAAAINTALRGS
jgi:hypothetical protein